MKYLAFLLFASVAFATTPERELQEIIGAITETISRVFSISTADAENCLRKTKLMENFPSLDSVINNVLKGNDIMQDEGSRNFMCLLACSAQAQGSMTGNRMNGPFIQQLIDDSSHEDTAKFEIKANSTECITSVQNVENQCEVAGKYIQCMLRKHSTISL